VSHWSNGKGAKASIVTIRNGFVSPNRRCKRTLSAQLQSIGIQNFDLLKKMFLPKLVRRYVVQSNDLAPRQQTDEIQLLSALN
jgi:hypothetical protein